MRKRFNAVATIGVLLSTLSPLCQTAFAQQSAYDTGQAALYTMPPDAIAGSTSERQAAWDGLSESEKTEVLAQMKDIFESAKKQKAQRNTQPKSTALTFSTDAGVKTDSNASAKISNQVDLSYTPTPWSPDIYGAKPPLDADMDRLTDAFENSLADGFTPYYYVSGGENGGTGFATFLNSVPQTVNQVFGATPPISHFRVTPLGFGNINGVQNGFIQIDYLTLWNKDDGLSISSVCTELSVGFGLSLNELTSHSLDNERAAILVAAPVVTANTFNTTASAYKGYQFFTAAHEDTFFDQSLVFSPQQPVTLGQHILLGFSRSKHGTYPFNPNYLPLVPDYIIYSVYSTLSALISAA